MTICSNCNTAMSDEREVFGHPSHPVCLLCWLDPTPTDEAEEDVLWVESGDWVPVPRHVMLCGECGGELEVYVYEWETDSRRPTEGGMWVRHRSSPCDDSHVETQALVEQWAIEHIRIMRSVPSPSVRIPGIKCPEIERREATPRREVAL